MTPWFAINRSFIVDFKYFMSRLGVIDRPATVVSSKPVEPATTPVRAPKTACRTLVSDTLFNGHREVLIDHDGEIYSLRHTRNGKLILTK